MPVGASQLPMVEVHVPHTRQTCDNADSRDTLKALYQCNKCKGMGATQEGLPGSRPAMMRRGRKRVEVWSSVS